MHLGTVKLEDNLIFYCNTHTPATGAAVDADAPPGYRVYENEVGTPLLTGSMALLDDVNTTGFYSEMIAVTAANGFEVGKNYCIRITGVVGGVTGAELHTFMIDSKRLADLNDLAQASILSDTTPFPGANIDAAISGAAIPGDAMALTAGERTTVAAVFLTQLLEGAHTVGDGLRIMLAALAGKSTGGGTFTNRFRDVADGKNRIDATVDANGNRTAISIDGT